MKKNNTTAFLSILLALSTAFNVYLAFENSRQRELADIHLKLARQKQQELSVFELRFEENLSVAKAAYARAEAQLMEAKNIREKKIDN